MQLADLHKADYDISKIFAINQCYWKNGQVFTMVNPRPTNAFLYIVDARIEVKPKVGEPFVVSTGSVLFIPMGVEYSITFYSDGSENPKTELFEFLVHDTDKTVQLEKRFIVINPSDFKTKRLILKQVTDELLKPLPIPSVIKMYSYRLLNSLLSEYINERSINSEYKTILSGIKYLESDVSQTLSIDEIAKSCFVSSSYFERLFKKYSGTTPTKYRIKRKIQRAKLLLNDPSLSVESISSELNFFDGAHFCRCFKEETGMTPSEYRRSLLKVF